MNCGADRRPGATIFRMRHMVRELDGALLDAAVAKAEGWHRHEWESVDDFEWRGAAQPSCALGCLEAGPEYSPSTDWAYGGPIIERERIQATPTRFGWVASCGVRCNRSASVTVADSLGPTALIAAMRAYVASRLDEEIELP